MEDDQSQGIIRKLKAFYKRLKSETTAERFEEEIQDLIDQGAEKGVITHGEGEMIQSIFEFGETIAREIMVPRTSIVAAPVESSIGDVLETIISHGHTRLPIYQGDIDHIEGILLAKDLLTYWSLSDEEPLPREVIRSPIFVTEGKKIVDLLSELKSRKSHMAVVLDEYGGTAGLVTLEDIIEEIIGDIHDEYDVEEENIRQIDENAYLVEASLHIEDLADFLGVEIPDGDYESVGGFITDLIGRLPEENEQVEFGDMVIIIRSADERKINTVEIRRNSSGDSRADAA